MKERHKNNNAAIWISRETRERIRAICWNRKLTYNQFLEQTANEVERETKI